MLHYHTQVTPSYIENVYSATGEKLRTQHSNGMVHLPVPDYDGTAQLATTPPWIQRVDYHGPVIYRNGIVDMVLFPGGYATIEGTAITFHYYTQDYLGNNRAVINGSTGAIEQTVAYYPYGAVIADLGTNLSLQQYKFGGKELMTANGLNEYDFGARQYYSAVPGFTKPDPLCEDTRHLSPYLYCGNNPVNAFDPDGRSTWVTDIGDGKYNVIGGDLNDKDKNIYIYKRSEDGKQLVRGKSIGQTTTMTDFYDSGDEIGEQGKWAINAIIDTNDHSGEEFFSNLKKENPSLFDDYAVNAQNNGKYDFKSSTSNHYRGMAFGTTKDGIPIYTSARDIGNIAAGYMAAANGLSWMDTRIGFDGYQSKVKGGLTMEGLSSRNAQYYGWLAGKQNIHPVVQMCNFLRSVEKAKAYTVSLTFKWLTGIR